MPSSHLILCRPLLLLPPIPPSIRVFSNESTLIRALHRNDYCSHRHMWRWHLMPWKLEPCDWFWPMECEFTCHSSRPGRSFKSQCVICFSPAIELMLRSSHLILCRPLILPPPIPHSIRVFSNESTLRMRWPKYWSFSFSIIPSKEHPGLISFRMDWLDLLAAQGTLKSLLQHHSSKASILWHSAFFTVQLSHPYMATGKKHSLD